eukprot:363049-Chlamydomonas_euryale.AAC.23
MQGSPGGLLLGSPAKTATDPWFGTVGKGHVNHALCSRAPCCNYMSACVDVTGIASSTRLQASTLFQFVLEQHHASLCAWHAQVVAMGDKVSMELSKGDSIMYHQIGTVRMYARRSVNICPVT